MILPPYTLQIPDGRRAFSRLLKTTWFSSLVLILVGCNSLTTPAVIHLQSVRASIKAKSKQVSKLTGITQTAIKAYSISPITP